MSSNWLGQYYRSNSQNFPSEIASTSSHAFHTRYSDKKQASGKLHDAYYNYRTKLAKANIIQPRSKAKSNPSSVPCNLDDNSSDDIDVDIETVNSLTFKKIYWLLEKNFHALSWKSSYNNSPNNSRAINWSCREKEKSKTLVGFCHKMKW